VREVILIHPEAPAKPPLGAPCNGCGVCCLAEPCPVGVLVSRPAYRGVHGLALEQFRRPLSLRFDDLG